MSKHSIDFYLYLLTVRIKLYVQKYTRTYIWFLPAMFVVYVIISTRVLLAFGITNCLATVDITLSASWQYDPSQKLLQGDRLPQNEEGLPLS